MAELIFFVAGTGAIAGAIGVVVLRNPFYAVLALVGHLLALAALFLLLRAEFVAAAQVVVYAGAVMVLYVFVVAYVGNLDQPLRPGGAGLGGIAILFAAVLLVELLIATLGSGLAIIDSHGAPYDPAFGGPAQIGELFLTKFLLAFEIASFLLLVAAVGAVILAGRRRGLPGKRRRPRGTSTSRAPPSPERWPRPCTRRRPSRPATPSTAEGGERLMAIGWYLAVSTFVFCIGAAGVLTRRNPLVVLLCLELMLNAANLALVAFSRAHGSGDGQIFALIVMVVAACEVVIGLGLIVAMHRRRLLIDVDEMSELRG